MDTKYLKRKFTEEGIKALETRLKTLISLYLKKVQYPFRARLFGFIPLKIISKTHHEGMIDELSQILGKDKVEVIIE